MELWLSALLFPAATAFRRFAAISARLATGSDEIGTAGFIQHRASLRWGWAKLQ